MNCTWRQKYARQFATEKLTETGNEYNSVGFEVLTALSTKKAVFWVVAPCSLVKDYQRFRGPCCLHHQGDRPLKRW
jgi:hypothetical protein